MKLRWLGAVGSLVLAAGCAAGSSVDANASDPGTKQSGPPDSPASDAGPSASSPKDGSSSTPIASHIAAGQIFLFGGRDETLSTIQELDDTWLSDGTNWKLQKPAHVPSPRSSSFAAVNAGVVTLFGGFAEPTNDAGTSVPTPYGDTWTYDGNDWTERHPAHSPSARFAGASASWKNGLLIFGGDTQQDVPTGETWVFDGSDWTQLHPAHSPVARASMSLAPFGESLLLFGGADYNNCYGDTWIFDGSDWIVQNPTHAPAPRTDYGMATFGGAVVIGGGQSGPSAVVSTTWMWSGSDWSELTPAHAPWDASSFRDQFAMVATADKVILFGGYFVGTSASNWSNDAWTWNGSDWASLDLGTAPTGRANHTLLFVP